MRKSKTAAKNIRTPSKSASRTNIVLDARLVARVKQLAGTKTTREAVQVALDRYARSRDYSRVLALHGPAASPKVMTLRPPRRRDQQRDNRLAACWTWGIVKQLSGTTLTRIVQKFAPTL